MLEKRLLEIIETAISREEEAYRFYMDIHDKVTDESVKDTISWIAGEEKKHKAFLVDYREGNHDVESFRMTDVVYYKIAEYQEEPDIEADMTGEAVFLLASHRELKSYKFYSELAALHPEGTMRTMLLKMANEELKHKEKMEYLYSNTAFPQTSGG